MTTCLGKSFSFGFFCERSLTCVCGGGSGCPPLFFFFFVLFCFERGLRDLIVLVPDHSLSF